MEPRADWKMPEPMEPTCQCGKPVAAYADNGGGEGWDLFFSCDEALDGWCHSPDCEPMSGNYIDWPFECDQGATRAELEAIGFTIIYN